MTQAMLGIVGGSGFYDLPGLTNVDDVAVHSPWGEPSDKLRIGMIGPTKIAFIPRHGRGHRLSPTDINYRANIDAMKRVGVTDLISLSAVGSFKAELPPGMFVFPDQLVDRTFLRQNSFFSTGCVAHVPFAYPIAPLLQQRAVQAAKDEGIAYVRGGTAVCIEGPQFSSKAESLFHKAQDWDLIGMTSMPEAKLCREAEISYAMVAMVTDLDAWHDHHGPVDVAMVVKTMQNNTEKARRLVARLAHDFPSQHEKCPEGSDIALDGAIMTAREAWDPLLLRKLDAVAARILKKQ